MNARTGPLMLVRFALAALLLGVCIATLASVILRNPHWTVDGFSYARMTLEDAGISPRESLKIAEVFYATKPIAHNPKVAKYFIVDAEHAPPAGGPIFRPRVLYPWLSSLLYPQRGLHSLLDVSALAYLAAVFGMYWLGLALARPWIAALGALAFAVSPLVFAQAESALTDMVALALWIVALASIMYFLKQPAWFYAAAFGIAALALVLTRQAVYLPFGAAVGAVVWARVRRDASEMLRSLWIAAIAFAAVAISVVWNAYEHGASIGYELEIAHRIAVSSHSAYAMQSFGAWYRSAVLQSVVYEVKRSILNILPVLALIAIISERRRKEVGVLVGATVAALLSILVHPAPYDFPRTLDAPLYPIVLAALAIGVERLIKLANEKRSAIAA